MQYTFSPPVTIIASIEDPDVIRKILAHLDEHVAAAVSNAEDHIAQAPTVNDLSTVASISPYRLNKRFRRVFGLTIGQWVLKQRIDFARQQLSDSDIAIATVAQNSGYADQSAFTRQFRLTTGISPSAFRRASKRGFNVQISDPQKTKKSDKW